MADVGSKPPIAVNVADPPGCKSKLGAAAVAVAPAKLIHTGFAAVVARWNVSDVTAAAAPRIVPDEVPQVPVVCVGVPEFMEAGLTGCVAGKLVTVTEPETGCVVCQKVPLTGCVAGKLVTATEPETGCVVCQKVPLTGCVAGKLVTATEPETG
jgi:hypothetical protein